MVEYAVQALLTGRMDPIRLVRDLARHWPGAPALDLIHVLAMAAGSVEALLEGPSIVKGAQDCWRMAGLVGVDLAMMRRLGLPHDTGTDLMAYWESHDRFFLD